MSLSPNREPRNQAPNAKSLLSHGSQGLKLTARFRA
jgi:hypothetical protein